MGGAEHLAALNSEDEKSPLVQHWQEGHGGQEWAYQMKILSSHRTPLSRQIEEGHRISSFKGEEILNRKGEWGENLPPKLVVEEKGGKKDDGETKSPQSRPQEKGKIKRSNPQVDQNPRAKKRNRN